MLLNLEHNLAKHIINPEACFLGNLKLLNCLLLGSFMVATSKANLPTLYWQLNQPTAQTNGFLVSHFWKPTLVDSQWCSWKERPYQHVKSQLIVLIKDLYGKFNIRLIVVSYSLFLDTFNILWLSMFLDPICIIRWGCACIIILSYDYEMRI